MKSFVAQHTKDKERISMDWGEVGLGALDLFVFAPMYTISVVAMVVGGCALILGLIFSFGLLWILAAVGSALVGALLFYVGDFVVPTRLGSDERFIAGLVVIIGSVFLAYLA